MAGAAEPTAAQAASYIEQHVARARPLLPWIAVAADGASPPKLASSFEDAISKPLETLVGRAYSRMWVSEELAPAARLAARLAVEGLAAGLPPADAGEPGMQASLLSLCYMLRNKGRWELLDLLTACVCAPLFTSETGLVDLTQLATDQQGRLRLWEAFPAVARRCAAEGRVEGAAAILAFVDEAGCADAVDVAVSVCTALASAAGAAFLSGLAEARQARLCAAVCKHAGAERATQVLAALNTQPECQPRARRVLAIALLKAAGQQCSGLLVAVPGLPAALAATADALLGQPQRGPPSLPDPNGWALPAAIVERFQCERSVPGQHCRMCQPVVAFMRSQQLETQPILRFEEGELQDNLAHIQSTLQACQQRSALNKFMEHRTFAADAKPGEGKGKKRGPKRQVAAARLWKVDAWYRDELAAYRTLKQEADDLQAALELAPEPAAPVAEPAECAEAARPATVAAAAAIEAAQEQAEAEQPEAAAESPALAQEQSAAEAGHAQQALPAAVRTANDLACKTLKEPAADDAGAAERRAPVADVAAEAADAEAGPASEEPAPAVRSVAAAVERNQPAEMVVAAELAVLEPVAAGRVPAAALAAEAMELAEQAEEDVQVLEHAPAPVAAANPGEPAAAAQLLLAEDISVLGPSGAAGAQCTPVERGQPSRPLVQCTLTPHGGLSRPPPPEGEAAQAQSKLASRKLSLDPQSTAKTAASGSTARKRTAAGSTAKKGGGAGSRARVWLARDAQRLRLPTLYLWFKAEHQHLSEAECASMAASELPPRRLDWQDSEQEASSAAVVAVDSEAAPVVAVRHGKRSRKA